MSDSPSSSLPHGPRYAEVALPVPLRQTFTYRLPDRPESPPRLGSRVVVPFGKRQLTGYVVALHPELPADIDFETTAVREIAEIVDDESLVTDEILRLSRWTADYYASSWGEVLKATLPAGLNSAFERVVAATEAGRTALREGTAGPADVLGAIAARDEAGVDELTERFGETKTRNALRELIAAGFAADRHRAKSASIGPKRRKSVRLAMPAEEIDRSSLGEKHVAAIELLAAAGGAMLFAELTASEGITASHLGTLQKRGIVEIEVVEVGRDPLGGTSLPTIGEITLTSDQAGVLARIENAIAEGGFATFLLHGVTGSGKTEVYIRAMRRALDAGRSSLMLVPEIALTPVFSRRLRAVFGREVAILHSNLSPGERFDEWRRIRRGGARIVIGTRSAVFAPLADLGLVIVDEEHDPSYRQSESPYYSGRDVAVVRASLAGAVAVLGSATPALETFHNSQIGKYEYLRLANRIGNRPLAAAEIVDMREVFRREGKDTPLSDEMAAAIRETHAKGEQSIILLNRRGFSQFVLCRSCGESIKCRHCDITLTYHRRDARLVCHYCNHRERVPKVCPACSSEYLYFVGEGTEQLEQILGRRFPELRIARVDRDTTSRRNAMERVLEQFSAGETDMLVGTQMLAKGHDFPNVTLVGVISVDAGLAMPDFRSAERTFQLLTQVAGRAGRGELPGRVMIQTYYPEHYALRHSCSQSYEGFYSEEIEFRRRLAYPPFVALASIVVRHSNYGKADLNAQIVKACLIAADPERRCRVLGVAPAPLARLRNEYRQQILVKAPTRTVLRETVDIALAAAAERGCEMRIVNVEIDPINLL